MKPIIGITACTASSLLPKLDKGNPVQQKEYQALINISESIKAMYGFNQAVQMVFENDLRAIEAAGGVALIIPATENLDNIDVYLRALDGVLITGGYDIDPKHYKEKDLYSKGMLGAIDTLSDEDAGLFATFSEKRDHAEIALVQKAYEKGIPLMGICRGNQIINTAFGGTIYQDILKQEATSSDHSDIERWNGIAHQVKIEEASYLYEFVKVNHLGVNTIHHQAIKTVGKNLKVVARADDGIIEAIESIDDSFVLGVQWHPEMLAHDEDQQKIFKGFISACKK